MMYPVMSAEEAARLIKNNDTVGIGGFSSVGVPKAVPAALAKYAVAEHEAGREFKVGLVTGGATGPAIDTDMALAHAVKFRTPFQSNKDMRGAINSGEVQYFDCHLSMIGQDVHYGFLGKLNVAIVEASEITPEGNLILSTSVGISPTLLKVADKVIVEINDQIPESIHGLHDIYVPLDPPCRREIPIYKPSDRAGKPTAHVDPKKVVAVVKTSMPLGMPGGFTPLDDTTRKIGENVCAFLANEIKVGRMPKEFLPIQSGVGNIANAVLEGLEASTEIPAFQVYTEVMQDTFVKLLKSGRCQFVSTCSLTLSRDCMMDFFDNIKDLHDKVLMRPAEISNHPEIIRRLGVVSMNTAIEVDIYGNANSTHICGTKMMNGIGGSGDFERNAFLSIFTCPSVAKGGLISSIVPFVSHQDHSEHDVNIIVTEQGIADLRGKSPIERAHAIIENCAHPDYKQLLWDYLKISKMGQTQHCLNAALALHDTFLRKGDMHLTDFAEYVK